MYAAREGKFARNGESGASYASRQGKYADFEGPKQGKESAMHGLRERRMAQEKRHQEEGGRAKRRALFMMLLYLSEEQSTKQRSWKRHRMAQYK